MDGATFLAAIIAPVALLACLCGITTMLAWKRMGGMSWAFSARAMRARREASARQRQKAGARVAVPAGSVNGAVKLGAAGAAVAEAVQSAAEADESSGSDPGGAADEDGHAPLQMGVDAEELAEREEEEELASLESELRAIDPDYVPTCIDGFLNEIRQLHPILGIITCAVFAPCIGCDFLFGKCVVRCRKSCVKCCRATRDKAAATAAERAQRVRDAEEAVVAVQLGDAPAPKAKPKGPVVKIDGGGRLRTNLSAASRGLDPAAAQASDNLAVPAGGKAAAGGGASAAGQGAYQSPESRARRQRQFADPSGDGMGMAISTVRMTPVEAPLQPSQQGGEAGDAASQPGGAAGAGSPASARAATPGRSFRSQRSLRAGSSRVVPTRDGVAEAGGATGGPRAGAAAAVAAGPSSTGGSGEPEDPVAVASEAGDVPGALPGVQTPPRGAPSRRGLAPPPPGDGAASVSTAATAVTRDPQAPTVTAADAFTGASRRTLQTASQRSLHTVSVSSLRGAGGGAGAPPPSGGFVLH